MLSSLTARRLLRSVHKQSVNTYSVRQFSQVLLHPLKQDPQLPQELVQFGQTRTDIELENLQIQFNEFNNRCAEELKEMNQNRITNIIERGGVDGWNTAADLAHLTKSFTFTSAQQAQYFVQNVGKFCSVKDHHPEWSISDGGRTVNVKLTSHFAGNKVTLFDFQLAEYMNQQYKVTGKWFVKYPYFAASSWSQAFIFFGTFISLAVIYELALLWANPNPRAYLRGEKPQIAHYRPIFVDRYDFHAGALRTPGQAEVYAKANVDDFAFKTTLFQSRNPY